MPDSPSSLSAITLFFRVMAGVVLCVSSAIPVFAADAPRIEHQRVLWMENPSREAVISWTTRTEGKTHRVHFGKAAAQGNLAQYPHQENTFKDGRFTMVAEDEKWGPAGFYHHVHLKDLEPATPYYFTIVSDGVVSPEYHFVTALEDDRPFSLLFGGDSRIDGATLYQHNDRRKMNQRMAALLEANPTILALVHGGDYCQKAEWRYLNEWLGDHEILKTKNGRLLPVIPTRGNHDTSIGFEEMFPWPRGEGKYYYSAALSPQVSFVVLNTEISLGGDQRTWLESELAKLRPANRWLFASYHRPAWPSVRAIQDGASRRDNWVPLFEQFNMDLVCESHDHALKRTLPIRGGEPDMENGIVYIGDGGLGVPQRKPDPTRWWFKAPGFTKPVHHVHMLEFGKDVLRVRAFGMDGGTLDDFRLHPRAGRKP